MVAQTTIQLPTELVERLNQAAKAMGLDLTAYLVYLEQRQLHKLSAKADDAAQFMFSKHGESLRKLAE